MGLVVEQMNLCVLEVSLETVAHVSVIKTSVDPHADFS